MECRWWILLALISAFLVSLQPVDGGKHKGQHTDSTVGTDATAERPDSSPESTVGTETPTNGGTGTLKPSPTSASQVTSQETTSDRVDGQTPSVSATSDLDQDLIPTPTVGDFNSTELPSNSTEEQEAEVQEEEFLEEMFGDILEDFESHNNNRTTSLPNDTATDFPVGFLNETHVAEDNTSSMATQVMEIVRMDDVYNITELADFMSEKNLTLPYLQAQVSDPDPLVVFNKDLREFLQLTDRLNASSIEGIENMTSSLNISDFDEFRVLVELADVDSWVDLKAYVSEVLAPIVESSTSMPASTTEEISRLETVSNEMSTEPSSTQPPSTEPQEPDISTTTTEVLDDRSSTTTVPSTETIYTKENRTQVAMINWEEPQLGGLVAAVVFGCVSVLIVGIILGKRIYDGYQRRHYTKMDYLVNGMYN